MKRHVCVGAISTIILVTIHAWQPACAQQLTAAERETYVGDAPANPGPLATDVSAALKQQAIRHVVDKVADWQLSRTKGHFNQDWTFAVLYRGLIAASRATGNAKYEDAVRDASIEFAWKLGPRVGHADDEAVAQSYLHFYFQSHDESMLAPTKAGFDQVMFLPEDSAEPLWWWCDALFMAPVAWVQLSAATGNPAYIDFVDKQWWITSSLLYDAKDRLYSRDATTLNQHETNGQKIYWSRGNGWVLAGLASVIQALPEGDPRRIRYIAQFQQMAQRIAALQGKDGLWRPGLLNADAYPLPEVSGSALFVYALAWGIDHRVLDSKQYLRVVRAGWRGLTDHVYADGRLGSIQPVGHAPSAYAPSSSYVFGVGAFLMAGAEIDAIASESTFK
jgi:unsaturated rhamnogalacturonyl hydrolase